MLNSLSVVYGRGGGRYSHPKIKTCHASQCLGTSSAVYVVCGDDDGMHYSITGSVLRSYLVKRLKAKV